MGILIRVLLLGILYYGFIHADELRWDLMHQNDYDVIPHHIELLWSNKSMIQIDKLEGVLYNRSYHRVLNASGTLLKEISKKDFLVYVQMYKFLSNTYKYFPLGVTVDMCKEWERNSFKIHEILKNYTNLKPCPQKPGPIHAILLDLDVHNLPPYIPYGQYKVNAKIFTEGRKLLEFEMFNNVVPKSPNPDY